MNILCAVDGPHVTDADRRYESMGITLYALLRVLETRGHAVHLRYRDEYRVGTEVDLFFGYADEFSRWRPLLPARTVGINFSCTVYPTAYMEAAERARDKPGAEEFEGLPTDAVAYEDGYGMADIVLLMGNRWVMATYQGSAALDRYFWLPVPIEVEHFASVVRRNRADEYRVLCVQRALTGRKGFHNVLAAWKRFWHPGTRLVCLGRPSETVPGFRHPGLDGFPDGAVDMMGYIPSSQRAYLETIASCDVVLNLSPVEGGEPGALLDPACCGLAPITTEATALTCRQDDDDLPDIVVDPDDTDAVVAALDRYEREPEFRRREGDRAAEHVRRYHDVSRFEEGLNTLFAKAERIRA